VVGTGEDDAVTGHAEDTVFDDLKLKVNRAFGYWFDYGDDWMHQIDVPAIEVAPVRGRYPKITARRGKNACRAPHVDLRARSLPSRSRRGPR
jgi:hypothetical protein